MSERQYHYDVDDVQHLFAEIISSLASSEHTGDAIFRILTDICRHFKFGCGFVYEADHTRLFHLREHVAVYEDGALPESFGLEKHFSAEEISDLPGSSVYFQDCRGEEKKAGGRPRFFASSTAMLVPIVDDDSTIIGLAGMIDRRRDILMSEQAVQAAKMILNLLGNNIKLRIFQRRLEYARQSLVNILDNTGIDIYVNDFFTNEILYVNQSMARPYGGRAAMMGKKCWQTLYADKTRECEYCPKKNIVDEDGNPSRVYSWDYQRPFDGSWFRVLSAAFRWLDGRLAHIVSSVDITANKNNEALIAHMANYDALTGLPNRRKLRLDYDEALGGDGGAACILFCDLDDFKNLNDSMGHQAGDELLAKIGAALMRHPLTGGHIYRYGGDEFVLFYHDAGREHARRVVDFLLERFEQPWQLKNASPVCRASIGAAFRPRDGETLDKLLHNADLMMYRAKQNGSGIACFPDGGIVRPKKAFSSPQDRTVTGGGAKSAETRRPDQG